MEIPSFGEVVKAVTGVTAAKNSKNAISSLYESSKQKPETREDLNAKNEAEKQDPLKAEIAGLNAEIKQRQEILDQVQTAALDYLKGPGINLVKPERISNLAPLNRSFAENISKNPAVPVEVLVNLAKDTPEHRKLFKDSADNLISLALLHPSVPIDLMKKYAKDKDPLLKKAVAQNPNVTADILKSLQSDKDITVRATVAGNNKTPPDILKDFAEKETNLHVLLALSHNVSNTPYNLVTIIERAKSFNGLDEGEDRLRSALIERVGKQLNEIKAKAPKLEQSNKPLSNV